MQDVVAAVAKRGERYMVCQRPTHKHHGGLWEFPGGKVHERETLTEAIHRELEEEISIHELEDVGPPIASIMDPGGVFKIIFIPVIFQADPEATEHDEIRWCSIAELGDLPLAPSDKSFVELHLFKEGDH